MQSYSFRFQRFLDAFAVFLSSACAIHCMLMPFILVLFPFALSSTTSSCCPSHTESSGLNFHQLMVWIVLPSSLLSFYFGYKRHQDWIVQGIGFVGIALLVIAAFFVSDWGAATLEKPLTLSGGVILAVAHIRNYILGHRIVCSHC